MTDMKLYEISEELLQVIEAEEFDEERLNELTIAFEQKAGGMIAYKEKMETFVSYCKSEEKRIADKRKAVENRTKQMLAYLKNSMEAAEMMEFSIGTKTLKIQSNPPAVVVDDELIIPARYFTVIPESKQLNKNDLKADLKNGEVDGAHLESGTKLAIK